MFHRICEPLQSTSFFLFGARATGKSTLLRELLGNGSVYWIDLLDPELEDRYLRHPRAFYDEIAPLTVEWVVLDEVQKCPALLNYVHKLIESTKLKFALTGSSARKLKRGAANLLAGRALMNELFPLTARELKGSFELLDALHWGSLPAIFAAKTVEAKMAYLHAYAHAYLKEEVFAEQLVRQMQPFRRFLEVAAQCHATQVSFRKIGREIGVDGKTVQNYFQILEDTLVGYLLYPHHSSLRKSLVQSPKFYLFDLGVQRALARTMESRLTPRTSAFGEAFESFIVLEIQRHNAYSRSPFRLEYYSDGKREIDLILSGGGQTLAIEIKSSQELDDKDIEKFSKLADELGVDAKILISQDRIARTSFGAKCLPWQSALEQLFPANKGPSPLLTRTGRE
jgi:predicted AAA+ superfamily ATPase